jgi:hypothetical protein
VQYPVLAIRTSLQKTEAAASQRMCLFPLVKKNKGKEVVLNKQPDRLLSSIRNRGELY